MPYVSETIKLSEEQDRRVKVTKEDCEEIVRLYATGLYSWNSLAKQFGISKSRVGQIVNPERAQYCKERLKEHSKEYRPSREKRNAIRREHRRYKQSLYLKGELVEQPVKEEKENGKMENVLLWG